MARIEELIQRAKRDPEVKRLADDLYRASTSGVNATNKLQLWLRHREAVRIYYKLRDLLKERYDITTDEVAATLDDAVARGH